MKSIKQRITVFAVIATLVPSLGLGLLSFRLNETLINDNLTRELRALATFTSLELDLWVSEHIDTARELSTSKIVIDGLLVTSSSQADMLEKSKQALAHYLRSVHEKLDTMLELTVTDTNGQTIASSAKIPTAATLPKDWPQNALIKGVITSPPHWDLKYATATLGIAIPVLSYDDFIIGALVATFDLNTLKSNLKNTTQFLPGNFLLLDSEGRVLFTSHLETDQSMSLSLDPLILQQLLKRPDEPSKFHGILQQKVIGLAYMPETLPITVIAERDYIEVYAEWEKIRDLFLALVGILILTVTAIALRMGHTIVAPLQRLNRATNRIAGGDFDVRLTVTQNDELGQLTQVFNQMTEKLRQNEAEITANNQAMQQKNIQLEALSITDNLTGLYNRSKLNIIISDQLARYKRNRRPFAVLMIDIDHFKTLNDNLGHIVGDEILIAVAKILAQSIRNIDFAIRYGGDEFIIILAETTADKALITAERIRSRVADIRPDSTNNTITVTLSIGIVQCQPRDTSSIILLTRADNALYAAKHAGRNQAFCIEPDSH